MNIFTIHKFHPNFKFFFFLLGLILVIGIGILEMSGPTADGGPGSPTQPGSPVQAAVAAAAAAGMTQEQMLVQMQAQLQVQQEMLLNQQTQMQDFVAKLAEATARRVVILVHLPLEPFQHRVDQLHWIGFTKMSHATNKRYMSMKRSSSSVRAVLV